MNKQVILGITICVILVAAVSGFVVWQNNKKQINFIQEVDRKLSLEDRKVYEDRLVEAEKFIVEAKDNQAKSDALIYKAVQLSGLGKLASARDIFLEAVNVYPENYNIYVHLYQVYLEMRDFKQAESNIKKSLALKENNQDAWIKYILLEVEKLHKSELEIKGLYQDAIIAVKDKIDVYTDYARYLEKIGDLQAAEEYWLKAIEANPEGKDLYQQEIDRIRKKQ